MSVYENRAPFTPWDDRRLANIFDNDEMARRVSAHVWLQQRVASSLAAAAERSPDAVAEVLRRQAAHHTWHASVWREHLAGGASVTDTLPAGLDHLEQLFKELDGATDVLESLAGLARVLAGRLVATFTFHRTATGADLDPDSDRWLGLILADLQRDREQLELILQSLRGASDTERLAHFTARLESPLVNAGGLLGPGTLGGTP